MRIGKKKGILHIFHNVAWNIYFDMLICAGAIFCSVGRGRRFRERRRGTVRDNFNVFNDHVNSFVSGSGVGVLQYSAKRKILGCVIPPRPGSLWPWAGCEFIQPSLHLLGEYCMLWLEAIKWRNVFGGGAGEWMTDPYAVPLRVRRRRRRKWEPDRPIFVAKSVSKSKLSHYLAALALATLIVGGRKKK